MRLLVRFGSLFLVGSMSWAMLLTFLANCKAEVKLSSGVKEVDSGYVFSNVGEAMRFNDTLDGTRGDTRYYFTVNAHWYITMYDSTDGGVREAYLHCPASKMPYLTKVGRAYRIDCD